MVAVWHEHAEKFIKKSISNLGKHVPTVTCVNLTYCKKQQYYGVLKTSLEISNVAGYSNAEVWFCICLFRVVFVGK